MTFMTQEKHGRILILGATGKAGSRLCQQAVDAGYQVDIIVRTPSKVAPNLAPNVRVFEGDMADRAMLQSMMANGYHAVLSTLGIYHKSDQTPLADMTANIIQAMKAAGVDRFVCMSSVGTERSKGQGSMIVKIIAHLFLKHVLRDKSAQEALIFESGLNWTIIRPPQLLDLDTRTEYCVWEGSQAPANVSWKISNADAAAEMLRVVDLPATYQKAFQVSYKK
jgi:uncharacterized protein YbjT (DUF2867 family)